MEEGEQRPPDICATVIIGRSLKISGIETSWDVHEADRRQET